MIPYLAKPGSGQPVVVAFTFKDLRQADALWVSPASPHDGKHPRAMENPGIGSGLSWDARLPG